MDTQSQLYMFHQSKYEVMEPVLGCKCGFVTQTLLWMAVKKEKKSETRTLGNA